MKQQVLQAVRAAFRPATLVDHLFEERGRVFGSVEVVGSPSFDELNDMHRQRVLWEYLREVFGTEALKIGPIVLEPTKRG